MAKPMSKVIDCEAVGCIYNKEKKCHTLAITVGDEEPCCDTFADSKAKGGFMDVIGGVGACKVANCEYNSNFECTASGIHMVIRTDHPDCGTFEAK